MSEPEKQQNQETPLSNPLGANVYQKTLNQVAKVTREKHPGRVAAGHKLAEWNRQNKLNLQAQYTTHNNKVPKQPITHNKAPEQPPVVSMQPEQEEVKSNREHPSTPKRSENTWIKPILIGGGLVGAAVGGGYYYYKNTYKQREQKPKPPKKSVPLNTEAEQISNKEPSTTKLHFDPFHMQ